MSEEYMQGAESTLATSEESQTAAPDVTQSQGEQSPGQQVVQPANTFNPKAFEYKYKGQAYAPKDRNHLVSLMSKGHSYEQAMASINKEKQQVQEMQQRYKPYEQLDQYFKQNPQFRQELLALRQKYDQNGQPQAQRAQLPPELYEKIQGFEQFQQQFVRQQADSALDSQINSVRQKYSGYDWNTNDGEGTLETKVLRFMQENEILNFEKGFKAYAFDMQEGIARAQGMQQAAQAQQQRRQAGVVDNGNPSIPASPKAPPNYAKAGYSDLAKMAKAELAGR